MSYYDRKAATELPLVALLLLALLFFPVMIGWTIYQDEKLKAACEKAGGYLYYVHSDYADLTCSVKVN